MGGCCAIRRWHRQCACTCWGRHRSLSRAGHSACCERLSNQRRRAACCAGLLPDVFSDTSLGFIHDGMLKGQARKEGQAPGPGLGCLAAGCQLPPPAFRSFAMSAAPAAALPWGRLACRLWPLSQLGCFNSEQWASLAGATRASPRPALTCSSKSRWRRSCRRPRCGRWRPAAAAATARRRSCPWWSMRPVSSGTRWRTAGLLDRPAILSHCHCRAAGLLGCRSPGLRSVA